MTTPERPLAVPVDRFHRHLSEPSWTPDQWIEAGELLADIEDDLADKLNGGPIMPGDPITETVPVDSRGLALTRRPVYTCSAAGSDIAVDGNAAPAGWSIRDGGLYCLAFDAPGILTVVEPALLSRVTVTYRPGWGVNGTFRRAILKRARAMWLNRHDDTLRHRPGGDGEALPALGEEWTAADLDGLSRYYWHTSGSAP